MIIGNVKESHWKVFGDYVYKTRGFSEDIAPF